MLPSLSGGTPWPVLRLYATVVALTLTESLVRVMAECEDPALLEEVVYDGTGQLLTGTFMDYELPRADGMPDIALYDHSVPSPSNPLGAKGAGEAGTTGAVPTVANAVIDALRPLGIHHLEQPYPPDRLWRAIRAARERLR